MWAINFGGAAAGGSKELLDLGQCFSSLLLSLHQFFFFFFGSIVCPWNHVLRRWGRGGEGGLKEEAEWYHLPGTFHQLITFKGS